MTGAVSYRVERDADETVVIAIREERVAGFALADDAVDYVRERATKEGAMIETPLGRVKASDAWRGFRREPAPVDQAKAEGVPA